MLYVVIHISAVQLQTIHHTLQCMIECGKEEEEEEEEEVECDTESTARGGLQDLTYPYLQQVLHSLMDEFHIYQSG